MPTFNIDTAAAVRRLERVGFPADQAREIVNVLAEADAEHVTKSEIRMLEQQMETGFANVTQQITTGIASIEVAQGKSNQRLAGIVLGGIAIATTIIVAVLA
ncbi:MAG: hypothetical protein OXG82_18135 [Gammaproteobacteria bacterium]|nr:hypothetical protein [Gammaproteobacteria bacterium]